VRYSEYQGQLRRLISIMKVRGGGFDPSLREFEIGPQGLRFIDSFKNAEGVLSGYSTERPAETAAPARARKQAKGRRPTARRRGKA
jgi:circadian clock protein KaiC